MPAIAGKASAGIVHQAFSSSAMAWRTLVSSTKGVGGVEQGLQREVTEWSWQAARMGTQEVDGGFGEEGLFGTDHAQVVVQVGGDLLGGQTV